MQITNLVQKELRLCIEGARALTDITPRVASSSELQARVDKIAHHVTAARTAIAQALAVAASTEYSHTSPTRRPI